MNYKKQKQIFFYALLFFFSLSTTLFAQTNGNGSKPKIANTDTDTLINTTPHSLSNTTVITEPSPEPPVSDPWETFNRHTFALNEQLDKMVMKPIATLYNNIVPKPINQAVHNFYNNIGTIPTIANDILQLNFYQASRDFWRFAFNSTLGIGGLIDVSTHLGLKYYSNDFGLTLSYWGYQNSTYVVLPFFGPSTIRDAMGLPVDYFGFSIYPYVEPDSARYALYTVGAVDRRAQLLKLQAVIDEAALDKYTFMRDAYLQRRTSQIEKTKNLGYRDQVESQSLAANNK